MNPLELKVKVNYCSDILNCCQPSDVQEMEINLHRRNVAFIIDGHSISIDDEMIKAILDLYTQRKLKEGI